MPSETLVKMRFADTTARPGVNHYYRVIEHAGVDENWFDQLP